MPATKPAVLTLSFRIEDGEIHTSLRVDGAPSGEKVFPAGEVDSLEARAARLLDREPGHQPPAAAELQELGEDLARMLLTPEMLEVVTAARGGACLWIVSEEPRLLQLPWELLPRPEGTFLIEGGHLFLRRASDAAAPGREVTMADRPGPLRVLFMACSPREGARLELEKEEAMVKLCLQGGRGVHLEIAESGTFEELEARVRSYRPHIVQLSGHAGHDAEDDTGYFSFEDERGREAPRSAGENTTRIFENSGVAMVFLSGCETAHSGLGGLCQALAAAGHVPLTLGWGLSVNDFLATRFAASLLKELAAGKSVNTAIQHARTGLIVDCRWQDEEGVVRYHTDFVLPRLFASGAVDTVFNPALPADPPPPQPTFRYQQLGDGIVGLAEGFVGRRRLLQTTRPPLRDGDGGRRILLLTGIGGAGKSTLTTRLVNFFEKDGWIRVALKPRKEELPDAFALRLLTQLHLALRKVQPGSPHAADLIDGKLDLALRLEMAIAALEDSRILLVLDNLESLLLPPPSPPEWRSGVFGGFFTELVNRLTGESRAILTSHYVPAGLELANAPLVIHQAMPDFTEADFFKCLEYDDRVLGRLLRKEITRELMAEFYRKLGATPRFVRQALPVLAILPVEKIRGSLAGIGDEAAAGDTESDDELRLLQQKYFAELFLPELYLSLSVPHRSALSRLAVSDVALPEDGIVAVTGLEAGSAVRDFLHDCLRLGLVQCLTDHDGPVLHAIYPLQRVFLTAVDRLPDPAPTHRALAEWLKACSLADREGELGLHFTAVYSHCLTHALAARMYDLAGWAATGLGSVLYR